MGAFHRGDGPERERELGSAQDNFWSKTRKESHHLYSLEMKLSDNLSESWTSPTPPSSLPTRASAPILRNCIHDQGTRDFYFR